jgi:hypothetical protein
VIRKLEREREEQRRRESMFDFNLVPDATTASLAMQQLNAIQQLTAAGTIMPGAGDMMPDSQAGWSLRQKHEFCTTGEQGCGSAMIGSGSSIFLIADPDPVPDTVY